LIFARIDSLPGRIRGFRRSYALGFAASAAPANRIWSGRL